jgi:DtxR family Mn-dependent transcriptional regulator
MPEHLGEEIEGGPHTSESEEMYLLRIAMAFEGGHQGPLKLTTLAGSLGVSSASANEMVRKLAARDLLTYEPYHGVALTADGLEVALRVLRTRRLWSCFLVDHLGFTPGEADAMACDLEHVTPPAAAERLAAFLGDPESGPLGLPIPPAGRVPAPAEAPLPLGAFPAGAAVEVVAVAASGAAAGFLASSGVEPGASATISATGAGGVLLETERGGVHLEAGLAASVLVRWAGNRRG